MIYTDKLGIEFALGNQDTVHGDVNKGGGLLSQSLIHSRDQKSG